MNLRSLHRDIFQYFRTLNLFRTPDVIVNEQDIHYQRLSTRAFIISFTFFLVLLLVHSVTLIHIDTLRISNPTLQKYVRLEASNLQTLKCPCSELSISQDTFLKITYSLDQICDSSFVTPEWISYIYRSDYDNSLIDMRNVGPFLFQGIQSYCKLAKATIENGLKEIYAKKFVSTNTLSEQNFQLQVNSLVDEFIQSVANSFSQALHSIHDIYQANGILPVQMTNYRWSTLNYPPYPAIEIVSYADGCSCQYSTQCVMEIPVHSNEPYSSIWSVPGLYLGCYVLEGLRQSRLECFYDQTCLEELRNHLQNDNWPDVIPLNSSASSRFYPNTTFGEVIDNLLVDEWNWTVIYDAYYDACKPKECTYTVLNRNGVIIIISTLIGLLGGLSTALKIIVPRIFKMIQSKLSRASRPIDNTIEQRKVDPISMGKKLLVELNFFSSVSTVNDHRKIHEQRISTRIFIVAFMTALFLLFSYNAAIILTTSTTIPNPSIDEYNELFSRYAEMLACPCSQISINHHQFLDVTYSLHQICASFFVTSDWISYIGVVDDKEWYDSFKRIGPLFFRNIQSLCELAQTKIDSSLEQLYTGILVTDFILPKYMFQSEATSLLQLHIQSAIMSFKISLQMILDTSKVNTLASGIMSNYRVRHWIDPSSGSMIDFEPVSNPDGCSCQYSTQCITEIPVYSYEPYSSIWPVPGLYLGCYVLEGLRQSRLECFYDQTCLEELRNHLQNDNWPDVIPLNSSASSRFYPDTIFGEVIDNLLVDEWKWTVVYDAYYDACKPKECTYTVLNRNGVIIIISTLIGLLGGLSTALKIIVPRLVHLVSSQSETTRSTARMRMTPSGFFQMVKEYLVELNLFPSKPPTTNIQELRIQYASTRIFLMIFSLVLTILLFYNASLMIVKTITISEPTLQQYNEYYAVYSNTLTCPCSQISIANDVFMRIHHFPHRICDSVFITSKWISFLANTPHYFYWSDFNSAGVFIFHGIQSLCELAQATIEMNLKQLYSKKFISAYPVPEEPFRTQVNILIEQFIASATNSFTLALMTIRDINQANGLLSAFPSNYYIVMNDDSYVRTRSIRYDDACDCTYNSQCHSRAEIWDRVHRDQSWYVPGFYLGCYMLEALRLTRLDCLYNQTCVNKISHFIASNISIEVPALTSSDLNRFNASTPFGEIIDQLLVDKWNWTIMYDRYFYQCKPKTCSYTKIRNNDIVTFIITTISLIGGLVTSLKILVPLVMNLLVRLFQGREENRIHPSDARNESHQITVENI